MNSGIFLKQLRAQHLCAFKQFTMTSEDTLEGWGKAKGSE